MTAPLRIRVSTRGNTVVVRSASQRVTVTSDADDVVVRDTGIQSMQINQGLRGPAGPAGIGGGVDDVDVAQVLPALNTVGDAALASNVALAYTPRPDSALTLEINGIDYEELGSVYYFSELSTPTPIARADIAAGHVLRWNASAGGFPLATSDSLVLKYERVLEGI